MNQNLYLLTLKKLQPIKQPDIHIDPADQCKRLLQFLYCCQQNHSHFDDLYLHTLDLCIKNGNEKIGALALQQIARHLSDNENNQNVYQNLIKILPLLSQTPDQCKPILATIQHLLSKNENQQYLNNLDVLYPYTARFLDLRREFRDSIHYFIDGDSLILSVAHHININLNLYYGNTLHAIFIIERILLTLFNQTDQCNYTLLFFECHYRLYQNDKSILTLLRTCLIKHLSNNFNPCRLLNVRKFSSWLDNDYIKFAQEENPLFIFYHDMSSFNINNDSLLSKSTLERLLCIYRLFGNYHQYYFQCHLYLMNKLILTDTIVQCFRIEFTAKCSAKSIRKYFQRLTSQQTMKISKEGEDSIEFEKQMSEIINKNDARIFLYLKTMMNFMRKKNVRESCFLLKFFLTLLFD